MRLLFCLYSILLTGYLSAQSPYQTYLEEQFNPKVNEAIVGGLQNYNHPFFKQADLKFFVIYLKNTKGEIVGGLTGDILGTCACVDYMWVEEKIRGQGLGSHLLTTLENYAKKQKCTAIQLYTYDFQAEHFYEKLGFDCIGRIPKWIENHDTVFFRKTLSN